MPDQDSTRHKPDENYADENKSADAVVHLGHIVPVIAVEGGVGVVDQATLVESDDAAGILAAQTGMRSCSM